MLVIIKIKTHNQPLIFIKKIHRKKGNKYSLLLPFISVAYLCMLKGYGRSKSKYLDLFDSSQGHDLLDT